MSAILSEKLTFGQRSGPEIQLIVHGDEFYARHETLSGYTAVYDEALGLFCYAVVVGGAFVSSGMPVSAGPPPGVPRHLHESSGVRLGKRAMRRSAVRPRTTAARALGARTFGPDRGLLEGRRLTTGTVRGLTILVNFRDVVSTVTQADVTRCSTAPTTPATATSARPASTSGSSPPASSTTRTTWSVRSGSATTAASTSTTCWWRKRSILPSPPAST